MFRALTCPSSGGKIVFTQHLLSSLSVNVSTVVHNSVTNILLMNKENCALKLVDLIKIMYGCCKHAYKNYKRNEIVLIDLRTTNRETDGIRGLIY